MKFDIQRFDKSAKMIATMCKELRPPKMSIPLREEDEDRYIIATLEGAKCEIECLMAEVEQLKEYMEYGYHLDFNREVVYVYRFSRYLGTFVHEGNKSKGIAEAFDFIATLLKNVKEGNDAGT
jgi:hypothetical protein